MQNEIFTQTLRNELDALIQSSVRKVLEGGNFLQKTTTPLSDDLPIDILEASKVIKRSVATIYGYVHRREIPVTKRGGKLLFYRKDLLSWLNAGKRLTNDEICQAAHESLVR
ncbi:MAG: helix-turn-helix domain-containing protein [Bacteroidota bacterium]